MREILDATPGASFADLKARYGIGSVCSSCEYETKGLLVEHAILHPPKRRKKPRGFRAELSYGWQQIKARLRPKPALQKAPAGPKPYLTGVFFMRAHGLESHLVISNLAFPEHPANANGASIHFQARLYGEDGAELGLSRTIEIPDAGTVELSATDLFPDLQGDFIGGLYSEFQDLRQTGSVRPYGVLVNRDGQSKARCHYHDKFALFQDPGFFHNTSPFEPGQTCWMALSNCQPRPYRSEAAVQFGSRVFRTRLDLPPMANRWVRLEDLFPSLDVPPAERSPGVFWLEDPQHIMVYFFWYNEGVHTWSGQHH